MAFSTQMKMLRAVREILLGDGRNALPAGNQPKPSFSPGRRAVPLPRSTPEAEGLSSGMLAGFYRAVAAAPQANPHALLVLRHGRVVSEGYFAPFRADVWHVTHSLCKSFIGAAVGLAIEEGLFTLEDKIVDYFPAEQPLIPQKHMKDITVRHLLTMTSGITYNEVSEAVDTQWLKGIFSSPVAFPPGERFVYNSMNSYLLSALICAASGTSVVDYLTPRLFRPMGFGPVGWEKSPTGQEKGGWGMYLMVEDMAKFGQLFLQGGRWQCGGKMRQLLPEHWVRQCTRRHATGDAGECYGMHLWLDGDDDAFIMNGMFGQYITVIPRLDIVIAMTAGNPRLFTDSPAYHLMRSTFYTLPALPSSLPQNPVAHSALAATLRQLRFRRPVPEAPRPVRPKTRAKRWRAARGIAQPALLPQLSVFCGTTWHFGPNRGGILPIIIQAMNNNFTAGLSSLRLEQNPTHLTLVWQEGPHAVTLPVGVDTALTSRLQAGREDFLIACSAELRCDEEGEPVLCVEVCFLEHSSCRLLKLRRQPAGALLLQIDEQPQFSVAIESVINQGNATGAAPQKPGSFGELLRNSDYLNHRITQLCTPSLLGRPAPSEAI
ncbi:MAG: serine hydrolase domain-containing protein [Oscillospiraceae bacterium]